jgi:hypothetical protein
MKNTISNIKPLDNQIIEGDNGLFDRTFWFYTIVGRKGQGKTNLITSLLNVPEKDGGLKKKYDSIYLVSPTQDPKFSELIEELGDKYYSEFNDSIQGEIIDRLKEEKESWKKKRKLKQLIIFDDVLAQLPHSLSKKNNFVKFIFNHRHLNTDVVLLAQRYNDIPISVRSQIDIISMFSTHIKTEKKLFLDEFGVEPEIYDEATEKAHSFLTINMMKSGKPILYKNFDKIE